jgi:hypothetical protein
LLLKQYVLLIMMQGTYYNVIRWDDIHYHIEAIDRNWYTLDTRVIDRYDQGDDGQVQEYCGIIQNIIKLDFRRFNVYVFDVQWFKYVMGKIPQCSIKVEPSGFTMIASMRLCNSCGGTSMRSVRS